MSPDVRFTCGSSGVPSPAAPPRRVMNSRRLMTGLPFRRVLILLWGRLARPMHHSPTAPLGLTAEPARRSRVARPPCISGFAAVARGISWPRLFEKSEVQFAFRNFHLDFVDLKTNSASNCRREKTTKKMILRSFCRYDFSHRLGPLRRLAVMHQSGRNRGHSCRAAGARAWLSLTHASAPGKLAKNRRCKSPTGKV
jgi:hypothetical protein